MALTLDDFSKILAGDGNQVTDLEKQKAQAILEAYEKDVQGLKITNAQLKEEKQAVKQKYDNDSATFAEKTRSFEEQIAQLQEELKTSSGKDVAELKKHYESQNAATEQAYKMQIGERDKRIADYEEKIKGFERAKTVADMEKEFMDAISKTKAEPSMYGAIKTLVLGENGSKFAPHDTETGRMFWSVDGQAKSIALSVDEFMKGELGKHFIPYNSSGSGAEGGTAGNAGVGVNPWITGNRTQQMTLEAKNPDLANRLKAEAQASNK